MIEINSLTAILAVETLVVLLLALILVLTFNSRKKKAERMNALELVDRINLTAAAHRKVLDKALGGNLELLPDDIRGQTIADICRQETELYRHIIQAFLTHDAQQLASLGQHVQGLSEPYIDLVHQLMERMPKNETNPMQERLAEATNEIEHLRAEVARVNEQLTLTLATLNEVSNEYAKMFGEPKTIEELHSSCKKVLAAFKRAEQLATGGVLPRLPQEQESP